jgi:hypothetical protein
MLIGSCDDLSTPRMLGPFRDLAPAVGPRLAAALQAGEPDLVMDALLDELHRPPPSTLVIEDVHWADEATVDTLRFLVRRRFEECAVERYTIGGCRGRRQCATSRGRSALGAARPTCAWAEPALVVANAVVQRHAGWSRQGS